RKSAGLNALRSRHHRAMKQWAGTGDATYPLHGMTVEVARPHGDGEAARRPHRPVVGEVPTCPGLDGDGEGKVEWRTDAEAGDARRRVGEDIENDRARHRRHHSPSVDATATR